LDKSSTSGRRRIVVVISDGDDTARIADLYSKGSTQFSAMENQVRFIERAQTETLRDVQRDEVTFYSINPSGQTMHLNVRTARSEQGMERIAAATGGAAFVPKNESELAGIFNRIAAEIRSQYLLQYYSNNEPSSRAYRRSAVATPARPELRVRSREGYYPKAKFFFGSSRVRVRILAVLPDSSLECPTKVGTLTSLFAWPQPSTRRIVRASVSRCRWRRAGHRARRGAARARREQHSDRCDCRSFRGSPGGRKLRRRPLEQRTGKDGERIPLAAHRATFFFAPRPAIERPHGKVSAGALTSHSVRRFEDSVCCNGHRPAPGIAD